jgi:5-methyltetrahydrofolate--homocysteine methyltransferase
MADFPQTVRERVVVYDGAMGTNIQLRNPSLDDYWGKENCSEVLVLSRPDIIKDIHAAFFSVGCDVLETNTFGGTGIVLDEFDLKDRVAEINIRAELADFDGAGGVPLGRDGDAGGGQAHQARTARREDDPWA